MTTLTITEPNQHDFIAFSAHAEMLAHANSLVCDSEDIDNLLCEHGFAPEGVDADMYRATAGDAFDPYRKEGDTLPLTLLVARILADAENLRSRLFVRSEFAKWCHQYRPVGNDLAPGAPLDGLMFETVGAELCRVRSWPARFVWTLIDDEDGRRLESGFRHANRLGFVLATVPFDDGAEITVPLD